MVCFGNRPPLEQFRGYCTVCLVFDSLFVLIFFLSGLSASAYSATTACYEEHGYSWHNVLALTVLMSGIFAAWGAGLHGSVVVSGEGAPLQVKQLESCSKYGHALVCWTFVAAILEAISYRQQPPICFGREEHSTIQPAMTDQQEQGGLTDHHVDAIWQMAYTVMWLTWVLGTVGVAITAKRNIPVLEEVRKEEERRIAERGDTPQLVGVPVQEAQNALPGTAQTSVTASFNSNQGGIAGAAVQAGTVQGHAMAAGVSTAGVAQGMPVRDEAGNLPPRTGPKEV
mmetsp:Transcript_854/g.1676  ORF Transcript_854/g.1676 Transcript_854/m.1676 type:complete len:284 (+) Transcript_854:62-913(+)